MGELVKQQQRERRGRDLPGRRPRLFADYRPSFNAAAAADAWKRCTDLFAKSLKA